MANRWDPATFGAGRWMGPHSDAGLRASDAERNEVAEKLSRHFAEGRLDQAEFKERLDKAMGATTRGDLAGLFDDLPRLGNESATHPRRRRLIPFLVIIALAVLAASWTVSTVHLPFLVFVGVGLFLWLRAGRRRTHHAEIDR